MGELGPEDWVFRCTLRVSGAPDRAAAEHAAEHVPEMFRLQLVQHFANSDPATLTLRLYLTQPAEAVQVGRELEGEEIGSGRG